MIQGENSKDEYLEDLNCETVKFYGKKQKQKDWDLLETGIHIQIKIVHERCLAGKERINVIHLMCCSYIILSKFHRAGIEHKCLFVFQVVLWW